MKFEKRLELLKEKVLEDDFLSARGLGNEIPFWIFDYPPEKDIEREIDGVIKVDKYDDNSVYTELEECVVTQERAKLSRLIEELAA